jgi:hypothetical protein
MIREGCEGNVVSISVLHAQRPACLYEIETIISIK